MTKESLALGGQQSRALAALAQDAEYLDENLAEVLATSKAGPANKAFLHGFLERVVLLLDSLGVTGPLSKSDEVLGTSPRERAMAWMRRNRWHVLAYTGLAVVVVVLLVQLGRMNQAIQGNREHINHTHFEVMQAIQDLQEKVY